MSSSRIDSPVAPIALVVATLLALAAAPIVVARLQAGPRARMDRIMDAQVAVNDLQEAVASGGPRAQLGADASRLVIDTRGLDMDAEHEATTIDARVRRDDDTHLDAASRHLEQRLDVLAFAVRTEMFRAARWNRIVPEFLVPLALVSVVALAGVARRAREDAIEAEAGRHAYARAMEEKAALARGVTHDLKNPLSAMLGYVHLLRDGIYGPEGDARRADPLARIERLVRDSLTTVQDLLEVARTDAGLDTPIAAESIDLAGLTRALGEDYRASAHAAGLALHVPDERAFAIATTDGRRVRRVVENLLSNAIKYTPAGGIVSLDVERHGSEWIVSVADTGPGVPPALRERVFDEFYRAPRMSASGAGIGLASSRRIARALGGDLTMRPRRDGGSVFELRLAATDVEETLDARGLSTRHAVLVERHDGSSVA